jgi:hypothetical protein
MPKVDIKRELLFERLALKYGKSPLNFLETYCLGRNISRAEAADLEKKAQDDFQTLCFEFGLELDDVVCPSVGFPLTLARPPKN